MTEPRPLLKPEHVDAAQRAQREFGLCDHCLGRLFAKVETGFTNPERARILREAASPPLPTLAPEECFVCEGLFRELDKFADVVLEALGPYEFDNYLIGSRLDADVVAREADVRATLGLEETTENANVEVNREVGRRVGERTGKPVEFQNPQVTAVIDTRFDWVELTHGGLFLFGRYRKFSRELPQTKWPCRVCRGRGCARCNRGGKMYASSVQELVEAVPLEWTGATESSFHGAGREDVDARALGTGRPFVLELKDPRKRHLDLEALERAINEHARPLVEVEGLRYSDRKEVVQVKESRGSKTYLAKVRLGAPVPRDKLFKAVEGLGGAAVAQRTPSRVGHRRADKVRKRRVLAIEVESVDEETATLRITGDAGLYIKELVSGDEGRTQPSLAGLLGVPAKVSELDILAVEYDGPGGV